MTSLESIDLSQLRVSEYKMSLATSCMAAGVRYLWAVVKAVVSTRQREIDTTCSFVLYNRVSNMVCTLAMRERERCMGVRHVVCRV